MESIIRIDTPAKASCHVETIRCFEKERFISSAKKAPNGYGIYFDRHLEVLHLIHNAKT